MKKTKVKKSKNEEKRTKGITLIALVITIIVLLILVGISIATLTGENGILTKTQNANVQNIHGAAIDSIALLYSEYQIQINTSRTTKIASTETVIIKGEKEKALANTSMTFLEFLQGENSQSINYIKGGDAEAGYILDVEKLTGSSQSLGNGTDNDVYKIEEQDGNYVLSYIDESGSSQELWSVANQKQSLGKLSDIVQVGDYINYAPTYTNTSTVSEGLGNGWRVAYVENGVVTLISEGVPLSVQLNNESHSNVQLINFDYNSINKLFDNTVADNIDIPTLEDIQLLCSKGGIGINQISLGNAYRSIPCHEISNDNIKIIDIGTGYMLNSIESGEYGYDAYYHWGIAKTLGGTTMEKETFNTDAYSGNTGVRLIVDLKSDLDYYGGTGTQGDPYQIY